MFRKVHFFILMMIICISGNIVYAYENDNSITTFEEGLTTIETVSEEAEEETEYVSEKIEAELSTDYERLYDDASALVEEENTILLEDAEMYSTNGIISISKFSQTIPEKASQDLVNKGTILYEVCVLVTARYSNGRPIANRGIQITAPYNSNVKLITSKTSTSTDSGGQVRAYFEVRGHGQITIQASCEGILNRTNIKVDEKCKYNSTFLITPYVISLESEYPDVKVDADGISGYKFRQKFLEDVKVQGSGRSTDNNFYIRYNTTTKKFERNDPITSTGTRPTIGKTIAVDNYYIPRYMSTAQYGCVLIETIGNRKAEDSGGQIKGYHIDVFVGEGKQAAKNFSQNGSKKTVTYLGNNKM